MDSSESEREKGTYKNFPWLAPWREAGLRGKRLGVPIRPPHSGHAALPAHASAIGTLAVH